MTEATIFVNDTVEQSEYGGYRLQVLPLLSSPVELFSLQAEVAVGQGSVCALAFFSRDIVDPVVVTAPIIGDSEYLHVHSYRAFTYFCILYHT